MTWKEAMIGASVGDLDGDFAAAITALKQIADVLGIRCPGPALSVAEVGTLIGVHAYAARRGIGRVGPVVADQPPPYTDEEIMRALFGMPR